MFKPAFLKKRRNGHHVYILQVEGMVTLHHCATKSHATGNFVLAWNFKQKGGMRTKVKARTDKKEQSLIINQPPLD